MTVEFASIALPPHNAPVQIEYQWIGRERTDAPLLVFLHEGLGSIAMWKSWPHTLCETGGFRGLVFSRPGYGQSTPRAKDEKWPVDFMHKQARDVLPAFLRAAGVTSGDAARPWLVGHSDGGSIALLYAAAYPQALAGAVVLAPHVFVEDVSVSSIDETRMAYLNTSLRDKLARYHDDVDSAFWGWNDIWLDPAFRAWNIIGALSSITCPLLAIQGYDDEYGTMAQMDAIAAHVTQAKIFRMEGCGHSPHRDAPDLLNDRITTFIQKARTLR